MNKKKRRLPRLLAAAPGAVAITALLCLLATVGGMEQGGIALGAGCVRGVIFLTVFAASAIVPGAIRAREAHRQHGRKRGENRA